MELLGKIEGYILGWIKGLPHLPLSARKWIADNAWWVIIVALVISCIGALSLLFGTLLGSAATAYILPTFAAWQMLTGTVSFVFLVLQIIIMAFAIKPLQDKQKKGWVLLFILWLVSVLSTVAMVVLSLSVLEFITDLIFGAIGLAIFGYFLFEIHGQYAHVQKSRGVKDGAKAKAETAN